MKKISKTEYKQLFEKALFKTFFHNPEWQEFLEKEFKWLKFEYYLYRGKILFPLARIGNKLISLPFCEYGGPLFLEKFSLDDFEKDVLEKFKNIKIRLHPFMLEAKLPTSASPMLTHWLDLKNKSKKELLSSFRKTLRHSIKKAQKSGPEIKECKNEKELKQFYNLYVSTLKRKLTVPYPYSVINYLFNQKKTEILLAFYKNRIIGGALFLHYDPSTGSEQTNFVHYFLSVSDYKYRNLGASYLILWEKIKSLIAYRPEASAYRGQDLIFDLGASPKGSALEIFKRGWGGKEYPILQIGIKRSEEKLRSSKLRKIWGLLPNFIIKKLAPYLIKYRI